MVRRGSRCQPPYDLTVSTFKACFDSTRALYPGSRDGAYYHGRAILWIYTLVVRKSEDFTRRLPLPTVEYATPVPGPDLGRLLQVNYAGLDPGPHI